MKLNYLAVAVAVSSICVMQNAGAAEVYNKDCNKLDIYGKVEVRHHFSDNSGTDGDQSYARLGFRGERQINDLITGYGQWEFNVQANHSENGSDRGDGNATRLAFAGLKVGDYGSFDYGRNFGILYDVASLTDVNPMFGGDAYTTSDNFMTGRTTGVATYRNSNFFGMVDGLNFAVQYQGANDSKTNNSTRDVLTANGEGWGMSTRYDIGLGVSAAAAYASSQRTDAQQHLQLGRGDKAEAWAVGLNYDANNIYLAAIFADTRNMTPINSDIASGFANKTQAIELVAQYQFDFGLRPSLGYVQSKAKEVEGFGDVDLVKYVEIGATYYFNANMSTYIDYKLNRLHQDNALGLKADDILGVGMTYQF